MSRTSLFVLVGLLAGCASGPPNTSGFLSNYHHMEKHPERKGAWVWYRSEIDLREYDRIMLDKVTVVPHPGSKAAELGEETLKKVAQGFEKIFKEIVDPYYTLVDKPASNVLWVRIAITDVSPAGKDGKSMGAAAIEGEFLDSVSAERLAAIVDRIEESTSGKEAPEEWRAVEGAFREWAQRLVDYMDSHHE